MDIKYSRELFLKKHSRYLNGKGKFVVFLSCGLVTFYWNKYTYPYILQYSTKIDKCSLHDDIKYKKCYKKEDIKDFEDNVDTNNTIFPKNLFPYFNDTNNSIEDIQQKEIDNDNDNESISKLDIKYIEAHLGQLCIPKEDIKQVITNIQNLNEIPEVSNVLNELIKNGDNNQLKITTDIATYTISGQYTSGNILQYNKEENTYKYFNTELEVNVKPNIKNSEQQSFRRISYFVTGLSCMAGIYSYNRFAHKILGNVKRGNIRTMAANVGLACLFSFVIASPIQKYIAIQNKNMFKVSSIDMVKTISFDKSKFQITTMNSPLLEDRNINIVCDIVSGISYGLMTYISGCIGGLILGAFMAL